MGRWGTSESRLDEQLVVVPAVCQEGIMEARVSALLVHRQTEPLRSLRAALQRQAVETACAGNCQEAWRILCGQRPPHLIFTDTVLPDGTWRDVLRLAARAPQFCNVIVVARWVDTRVYIEAIEAGAFDFLVPSFAATDLAHIVHCAADNALSRRAKVHPFSMGASIRLPHSVQLPS